MPVPVPPAPPPLTTALATAAAPPPARPGAVMACRRLVRLFERETECDECDEEEDARRWRCMRVGSTLRMCAMRAKRERTVKEVRFEISLGV